MPRTVDIPTGQEVTPEFVQQAASTLGIKGSPARQQEAQAAAAQPAAGTGGVGDFLKNLAGSVGTSTGITPLLAPSSTLGERAMGAGQLGLTAAGTMVAPWLTLGSIGAGATAAAGLEAAGESKDSAQLIGGLVELAGGVGPAARKMFGAGKSLVKGARKAFVKLAVGEFKPSEQIANAARNEARTILTARAKPLKAEFNAIEREVQDTGLKVAADSTAGNYLDDALDFADTHGLPLTPRAKKLVRLIERESDAGNVSADHLMKLRKEVAQTHSTYARADDPNLQAQAKLLGGFRRRITEALETAMPPDMRKRWDTVRVAYADGVATPKRAIRTILNKDTTAQSAFDQIFNLHDQNAFRALVKIVQKSPAASGKLRLGYLETLRKTTGNFEDTKRLVDEFQTSRPLLESIGLFNAKELDDLNVLLRRRAFSKVSLPFGVLTTALAAGGAGAGYLHAQDPTTMLMGAVAAGALPQLRAISLLPRNSPQAKVLGALVSRQLVKLSSVLTQERTESPADLEEPELEAD